MVQCADPARVAPAPGTAPDGRVGGRRVGGGLEG
jgi:hypothetical protein